ncbi:MAG: N-acetyl-gamma-glutamyl-phosphate reductase [Helicobacteraceae bacterium]|jgi:N-acetyl-gamma-glutamyl-phosphate reductase|nr:N-acetyl-gamma-glutamyl-phosphate reductase [Helicobacteraceae bacterium]
MKKIPVALIGASGYTGLELIKILLSHPYFEIAFLGGSEGGEDICAAHPSLRGIFSAPIEKSDFGAIADRCSLAFLAVPHTKAIAIAKELLARGVKVVDLSADYRLKRETYEAAYGVKHDDAKNLAHAVYGLSELVGQEAIASAKLTANPGCYPTASLLAAAPFLPYADLSAAIIIDAKSGVSGAGRQCVARTHFATVNENCFTYSPIVHRHAAEIEEKLRLETKSPIEIVFAPHLLPITRGMLASVYLRLKKPIDDPTRIAREFYAGNPFVRARDESVQIKWVVGTHYCDIFCRVHGGVIFAQSAIDNLLRGASSAAIANANLMCALPYETALPLIAYAP